MVESTKEKQKARSEPLFPYLKPPLPFHSHVHEFFKFRESETYFCSTDVVKVQVSSILKENKDSESRARFDPGVPDLQSPVLTTRPPRIRCKYGLI